MKLCASSEQGAGFASCPSPQAGPGKTAPVHCRAMKAPLSNARAKTPMTDISIRERRAIGDDASAPIRRARALSDDKAMLKAAANLTRDLNVPDARIYWADLIGSASIGYAGLFA